MMIPQIKNVDIPSSYTQEFGNILYEQVMIHRPKVIYDIGVLGGFSTAFLAMAAKELKSKVIAIDLFEDYEYNSVSQQDFETNMNHLGLMDVIESKKISVDDWIDEEHACEFIHIDVSNTGDNLVSFFNIIKGNPIVLFEGGSVERDNCDWMIKYNKKKIIPTLEENNISFELLKTDVVEREGRILYPALSKVIL
jgi:hypothetical protein